MAKVVTSADERVFRIQKFLGLNENPDGDTKLKMGEASVMRNFKITRDSNLQRRPGLEMVVGLLRGYETEIAPPSAAKVVRTDHGTCSTLTFWTALTDVDRNAGLLSVTGSSNTMTYADVVQIGHKDDGSLSEQWYYKDSESDVYKLTDCTQVGDDYVWTMQLVTVVNASTNKPVRGLWAGNIRGKEYLMGAADGILWRLYKEGIGCDRVSCGTLDTTGKVFMFGYSEILYILNGSQFKQFDGESLKDVEGYRPIVSVSVVPAGGGTTYEQVNKLNGLRRCWVSPDGTATVFHLPETGISSVDWVKTRTDDATMDTSKYTVDLEKGTVTFKTAPTQGVNTLEIAWTHPKSGRSEAVKMRFAETYNGANDNRVFFYGDGTNRAFYTGLDYNGKARADYWPDMNVLSVGEANTPVTALIRHYSRLIVFKSNATYSVQYGVTSLADDTTVATFYATPVNRSIGNAAMGQAQIVLNYPRTLFGHDLYEWRNSSSYTSNLTIDERQAQRISDRIMGTLADFDTEHCTCWDDNDNQEYYILSGDGRALVHNYAADAWYLYTDFDATCLVSFKGQLYAGDSQGRVNSVSYENRTDNGTKIESYWESGSEAFGQDYMRKYSAMLWVGIKPEPHGEVFVTVQTDRKSVHTQKIVSSSLAVFDPADFRRWSFNTNRKPHMNRLKIKAKKFVFYKLIFYTESINTTVTILSADMRVRFTGYAK